MRTINEIECLMENHANDASDEKALSFKDSESVVYDMLKTRVITEEEYDFIYENFANNEEFSKYAEYIDEFVTNMKISIIQDYGDEYEDPFEDGLYIYDGYITDGTYVWKD